MLTTKHTILHIIRHGETDWNTESRIQGHTDIPLNAMGEQQALSAKQYFNHLPIKAVYSSDLLRAQRTAELLVQDLNLTINVNQSLRERCYGILEGLKYTELPAHLDSHTRYKLSREEFLNFKTDKKQESYMELHSRINPFLYQMHDKHPNEHVLLVTHAGVIRSIVIINNLLPGIDWKLDNCSFITVKISKAGIELLDYKGITLRG